MAIVASEAPALYIPSKELVVYHRHPETSFIPLSDVVNKMGDLKEIVKVVLSDLLTKLEELSIPFRPIDLSVEHDPEITSWKYAVVEVKLETEKEIFDSVSDLLTDYAYSNLLKEDASKVLLVITCV